MSKCLSFSKAWMCISIALAAAITLSAQKFETLVHFNGKNGSRPYASLEQAIDGNFYGTTEGIRGRFLGTAFKMTPRGSLTILNTMKTNPDGWLLQTTGGNLYGTTVLGGRGDGTIFEVTPEGVYTTVVVFQGEDGASPDAGLILATDGNLYGTTYNGGTKNAGTVFRYTTGGTPAAIYSFCVQAGCADGENPSAGVIQASDGNFYGTTTGGGTTGGAWGTVYRVTPQGSLTTLYSFCAQPNCTDGNGPWGGLVQATDGNLYGTTSAGGACQSCGTIFRMTLDGSLTTMYSFPSPASPNASLIQATDGALWGAVQGGGTVEIYGYIFNMKLDGTFSTVYSFTGGDNGNDAVASLLQATDGKFYGTTFGAPEQSYHYFGTVFRLNTGLAPFLKTLTTSGSVGSQVTILGTDLTGAKSVRFNGTPAASFTVNSTGSAISTTVPAGATTGKIHVVMPDGTILSSNLPFDVT